MPRKPPRKLAPLPSRAHFFQRLGAAAGIAMLLIAASQVLGMAGYMYFEDMSAIDAFANAAMILSGMGPLAPLNTTGGKLFAGCYALYSGLVLILATGLILGLVFHRVLHRFHLEQAEEDDD